MTRNHASQTQGGNPFSSLILWIVASLVLCGTALAANPQSWWNDIANDRVAEVRKALARGADPNEISPAGQPAIMQAVRDGSWNVYDLLAANSKTVLNAINVNRETPLMYLAVTGETQRAQDLIKRGALVNRLGWTPLHYAASKGHLETVKMLVANKAIVNAPGPDGTTALMMAAYAGSEPVVQYLLNEGADATMKTTQQYDAAHWARLKNHTVLADKLDVLSAKVVAQRNAQRGAGAASQSAPPAPAASAPQPDTSTSRYFNLERFDEDPEP